MDDFNPVVLIGLAVLIAFVIMIVVVTHKQKQRELQNFTRELNGHYTPATFTNYPRVTFPWPEATVTIGYSAHGDDGTRTHLTVPLTEPRLRLELRPQGLTDRLGKFLGMEDIEIGSPEFDEAFVIQGADRERIRQFLTPPVQATVMRLANCRPPNRFDLHLAIGGGTLRITKDHYIYEASDLARFIRCCRDLFELVHVPLSAGIEFVEKQAVATAYETECQVCGDPLIDKIVYCTKCKTPHHLDCWQYFGSCAVYGCGQKRYVTFRQ